MRRLFRIYPDPRRCLAMLTRRQRALVMAAASYHTLVWPGKTLIFQVYLGEKWQYPRLTDISTLNGSLTAKAGLHPATIFSVADSRLKTEGDVAVLDSDSGTVNLSPDKDNVRYILLTPDDANDETVRDHQSTERLLVRMYKSLEQKAPIGFDYVRELARHVAERRNDRGIPQLETSTDSRQILEEGSDSRTQDEEFSSLGQLHRERAVIIAMYWLQAGGAEQWGLETIRLTKQAGLLPIVITDRDSQQPWITDAACDEALVLPLTRPVEGHPGAVPLLEALYRRYDIKGILVHHCQWMYDQLRWVKQHHHETYVVDSLHILEYVMQGGYPREAVTHDRWIDLHHVISPQLERWMVDGHHIAAAKVVDAPLIGLSTGMAPLRYKVRDSGQQLVVAFVGRMTRQKRPEAFILLARKLEKSHHGTFRFIMHGSGDMEPFIDGLIVRYGLGSIIERRSGDVPVSQTYRESDVLLISSINEGITLTTIEAISAGIPVLSTDVGSQKTLVSTEGLLPRLTSNFIRAATQELLHIDDNESEREALWENERRKLMRFSQMRSADELFKTLLAKWSK